MKRGFTLIELLVVIAIVSMLAAVILTTLDNARESARVARAVQDLKQIELTLSLYLNDTGVYPCFDHSWDTVSEEAWAEPYLDWPTNPWGYTYHWEHDNGTQYSIAVRYLGLENATAIDNILDNGNLSTGIIRGNAYRIDYSAMDQSPPLIDCHV